MDLFPLPPWLVVVVMGLAASRAAVASPGSSSGSSSGQANTATSPVVSGDLDDPIELARRGVDAVNKLDFETACKLFRRSLELRPSVKVLLNLAVAELNGGHPLEAAEHFRAYVLAPDAAPDRAHTVREEFLPKAYAEVGRLMFDVPDGTPIRLNGKPIVAHPGEDNAVLIPPGTVRLELTDGRMVRVTVEKGQVAHIVFPPMPASLASSPAGAPTTDNDGNRAGGVAGGLRGPHGGSSAGGHIRGGDDALGTGAASSTRTWLLIGGGLLTVGSIATGTYFTLASNSADARAANLRSDLNSQSCADPKPELRQTCQDLQDAIDRGPRERNIALVAWVAAGAIGAATLVSWMIWPTTREQSLVVAPTAWNGGWGAVARASF